MPHTGEVAGTTLPIQSIWIMVQKAAALVPDWVFKETTTASSLQARDSSRTAEEKSTTLNSK